MRLYDRMLSGEKMRCSGSKDYDTDTSMRYVDSVIEDHFAAAVPIDIDNVARYHDDQIINRRNFLTFGDIPLVRPPFMSMWLEWKDEESQVAILLWESKPCHVSGLYVVAVPAYPPCLIAIMEYRYVQETGAYEDESASWEIPEVVRSLAGGDPFGQHNHFADGIIYSGISIVATAIGFMHCKNVLLDDAKPVGTRQQRRDAQRKGMQEVQFKTLVIEPMKQVLKAEGGIEQNGLKRALHICRGHFSHYSEDRPLFGKYTGTFWRPAHVRGSSDVGTVYKDYKVNP